MAAPRRKDAARLRKELDSDRRGKAARKLARLRADLKAARQRRNAKVTHVRKLCRLSHERYLASSLKRRRALFAELRAERDAKNVLCRSAMKRAKLAGKVDVTAARRALGEEHMHQRQQAIWERPKGMAAPGASLHRHRERERESDEQVAGDIDPGLLPVWRVMKKQIRATDRSTRTEAFLHWVHDHPAQIYEILDRDAAEHLKQLEREQEEHADSTGARPLEGDQHDSSFGTEDDVPF